MPSFIYKERKAQKMHPNWLYTTDYAILQAINTMYTAVS